MIYHLLKPGNFEQLLDCSTLKQCFGILLGPMITKKVVSNLFHEKSYIKKIGTALSRIAENCFAVLLVVRAVHQNMEPTRCKPLNSSYGYTTLIALVFGTTIPLLNACLNERDSDKEWVNAFDKGMELIAKCTTLISLGKLTFDHRQRLNQNLSFAYNLSEIDPIITDKMKRAKSGFPPFSPITITDTLLDIFEVRSAKSSWVDRVKNLSSH